MLLQFSVKPGAHENCNNNGPLLLQFSVKPGVYENCNNIGPPIVVAVFGHGGPLLLQFSSKMDHCCCSFRSWGDQLQLVHCCCSFRPNENCNNNGPPTNENCNNNGPFWTKTATTLVSHERKLQQHWSILDEICNNTGPPRTKTATTMGAKWTKSAIGFKYYRYIGFRVSGSGFFFFLGFRV